jgi:hypothetical protein
LAKLGGCTLEVGYPLAILADNRTNTGGNRIDTADGTYGSGIGVGATRHTGGSGDSSRSRITFCTTIGNIDRDVMLV